MTALPELADVPAVALARRTLPSGERRWIVGGALRDAALGRPVVDLDLAVPADEREIAGALADAAGGDLFRLSEEFAAWRVIAPGQAWSLDVVRLRGGGIEEDLAGRDFTVNAMALPLEGGALLDPYGGRRDLDARRLRAVSDETFSADPLRLLRAARLAAQFDLEIDGDTAALARGSAGRAAEPSGERLFRELRLLVAGPDPVRGLALLDEMALTAGVLPELEALRGVEQNPYHHLDVHGHTLAVLGELLQLESALGARFGDLAGAIEGHLEVSLGDGMTRGAALRLGALFHDLGKPATRALNEDGRVLFIGHDRVGAELIRGICRRFRTSRRVRHYLEGLVLHHLRLGFLVHERPLPPRRVYDYLVSTEPVAVEVTLLSVADRLATRGEKTRPEAVEAHLELAGELMAAALVWRRDGPPPPPLGGDELAAEIGIEPGPRLGAVLREIEAAQYAGEVGTREQAVAHARRFAAAEDR